MAYKYRYGYEEEKAPPLPKLEKRSFVKFLILHILTLGLYSIIFFIPLSYDINKIAPRHGNKTMNFLLAFLLAIPTSNIIMIYWFYQITDHIEEALDRRKILNEIWGENYYSDDKIVDVNIRRLRIKVEDEPSAPKYIQTVWGYGYKWGDTDQEA